MEYFLRSYIGLNMAQIELLQNNKTRATVFIKSIPHVFMQERNIYTKKGLMSISKEDNIKKKEENKEKTKEITLKLKDK